jgi:hypothetical protein
MQFHAKGAKQAKASPAIYIPKLREPIRNPITFMPA